MARRNVSRKNRDASHRATKSAAPLPKFLLFGVVVPAGMDLTVKLDNLKADTRQHISVHKFTEIKLPATLADVAGEVANAAFCVVEELAFKAGIEFEKEKPKTIKQIVESAGTDLQTEGNQYAAGNEDIPF